MSPADAGAVEIDKPARMRLDNLTLSRKEGWRTFAEAPDRVQPERLTLRKIKALDPVELEGYNGHRQVWHANIGPLRTPQLDDLHQDLWDIVDSNAQDGDKAKGAAAVDAFPGLGKTTSALAFGKKFHLREIAAHGAFTEAGHERWPVCRIGLTGNTGMKDFNRAMMEFFGHPGTARGTATQYAERALDLVLLCEVRLLIIDDLHFLAWNKRNGAEVSNHFKYIANEFPLTLLFIGVNLDERGVFSEGTSGEGAELAQLGRRTTPLTMAAFTLDSDKGRQEWRNILLAIEKRLVLARKWRGMLADDLSEYLFARSSGHIGSLMTLINRGCLRAVRTGEERLTKDLLDRVKLDAASEKARKGHEAALMSGRRTAKVVQR